MALIFLDRTSLPDPTKTVGREAAVSIDVLLPLLAQLQGRKSPLVPPVVLVVGEDVMDLLYPPERVIGQFDGDPFLDRDDAWGSRHLVASGVCVQMAAGLTRALKASFDDPDVFVAGGRLIGLCASRLVRLQEIGRKNLLDPPESLPLSVVVRTILAHELIHWSLMGSEPDEDAMSEAVAQIVGHLLLERAPNGQACVAFMKQLAGVQPPRYGGYLPFASPKR